MIVRGLGAVVAVAGALLSAPTVAQGALTPDGPATVRGNFLGPHTLEGRPPEVLAGWSVTVGPGSRAGPVRLRVLRPGDRGTVVGSGRVEWLPAPPGRYQFGLNPPVSYDYRDAGLALDQQVGGHAIVATHVARPGLGPFADPAQLYALDVFRPLLGEGARDVSYSERRLGDELLVRPLIELARPPAPRLRLRVVDRRRLRFSLTSTQPGNAKIVARVAGLRLSRKLRFNVASRRTVRLVPATRRDRRRLAAARRRPGKLRVVVSATMRSARVSLRLKL